MANSVDTTYSIIKQVSAGATPATPAFMRLDYVQGATATTSNDVSQSNSVRPSRSATAVRKHSFIGDSSLSMAMKRDSGIDALLESALSNTFSTNILKGGNTDVLFTMEKYIKDGSFNGYMRWLDCQVSKFSLKASATDNVMGTFDIVSLPQSEATAILTGATYTASSSNQILHGADMSAFTIGGLTAPQFADLELTIETPRTGKFIMGNVNAQALASGARTAKLTATLFRGPNFEPETVTRSDTPVAVGFTFTQGSNLGYQFTLPKAVPTIVAQGDEGDTFGMVKVEFTMVEDTSSSTDIQITRV